MLNEQEMRCLVQPEQMGWFSSHYLRASSKAARDSILTWEHGNMQEKEDITRRMREEGTRALSRTLMRRLLHCWQLLRDLRCEARDGIGRRDHTKSTSIFPVALATTSSSSAQCPTDWQCRPNRRLQIARIQVVLAD